MPGIEDDRSNCPKIFDLFLATALSLLVYAIAQHAALSNPYAINDDVRQQIYWMQKWQDPAIYPPDLLNNYAQQYVPCGIQAIYRAVSGVIDPLSFSKVLTGIIFVILGTLIFATGHTLKSRSLGWACLATYWLMPFFLDTISGGIARSFAFPLIILFMLGWFARRPWTITIALFLQAVLIPYIFLLCISAVCLSWLLWKAGRLKEPALPFKIAHLAVICTGFIMVLAMKHSFDLQGYGPMVTRAEMKDNPLFTAEGRYEIGTMPALLRDIVIMPWEWIAGFHELGTVGGIVSILLIAGTALAGTYFVEWKALKPYLPATLLLCMASLGLYFLAYILLLRLFVPDRYLMYTVNILYCFLLAIAFHALWSRFWNNRLAGAGLVLLAVTLGTVRLRNVGVFDYSADAALYAAVEKMPKSALFAAHPWLADNVLTFGRRNVLVSSELAHPWASGYWRNIEPRLSDFFNAYYSADPEAIRAFCCKYRIDILVVDRRHFAPAFIANQPFFAPFDRQIQTLAAGGHLFCLATSNEFHSIRINEHQSLIDASAFRPTTALPRKQDPTDMDPLK